MTVLGFWGPSYLFASYLKQFSNDLLKRELLFYTIKRS